MSSEPFDSDDAPPLTETIAPGTASDPPLGAEDAVTVTVDGTEVTVGSGATLLDAVEAVDTDDSVPALCQYDRQDIGPRSECRTCMVETDEHGVVPACSFPAEEGLDVETAAADAAEARDVNLDLVLSDHNLRCTTCGKNGRCDLQDAAIEQEVEEPRYAGWTVPVSTPSPDDSETVSSSTASRYPPACAPSDLMWMPSPSNPSSAGRSIFR